MKIKSNKISVLYGVSGGIIGSALFAVTTLGGQAVTNAATLIAGLGGGVISGLLTLRGVRHTIELQKEKELEDSKPQKVRSIHIMIKLTEEYKLRINMLEGTVKTISEYGNTERLNELVEYLDRDGMNDFDQFSDKMIKESLSVNREIYFPVKENLGNIRTNDALLTSYIHTGTFHPTDDLQENITGCIGEILVAVNNVGNALEQELTKYEESLFLQESEVS
ncbi:hypothetical protein V7183_18710 [Bacillus sp. JJ1127]|uniref:hypothetical protein n=1 Tax=Bacillus sp. JJ1127 TaxID=3122952 RepID=UPI002FFE90E2